MFESPWYDLRSWLCVKRQLSICLHVTHCHDLYMSMVSYLTHGLYCHHVYMSVVWCIGYSVLMFPHQWSSWCVLHCHVYMSVVWHIYLSQCQWSHISYSHNVFKPVVSYLTQLLHCVIWRPVDAYVNVYNIGISIFVNPYLTSISEKVTVTQWQCS